MTSIALESIVAVAAGLVGRRVDRVERLAGSVGNRDFMLFTSIGDFVLKASALQDLGAEAWACQRAARAGVVTPEIVRLEVEPSSLPLPILMMRRLPGAAVDQSSPALTAAGQQLARMHSVQVHGYGGLAVEGSQATGSSKTWAAFITELTSGLRRLVTGHVLSEPLAAAAGAALEQSADELSFSGPGALLHGDLKPAHIFVTPDDRVGLIDWGDACVGDPRLDLARMSMAGATAFAIFMSGYGMTPTPDLGRVLAAYRLVWNIDALDYEHRAQGSWFDSYRSGIQAAVTELTGRAPC